MGPRNLYSSLSLSPDEHPPRATPPVSIAHPIFFLSHFLLLFSPRPRATVFLFLFSIFVVWRPATSKYTPIFRTKNPTAYPPVRCRRRASALPRFPRLSQTLPHPLVSPFAPATWTWPHAPPRHLSPFAYPLPLAFQGPICRCNSCSKTTPPFLVNFFSYIASTVEPAFSCAPAKRAGIALNSCRP